MIKKSRPGFFDKLVLWLNYLFCVALLLSYLAPITNPSKYWFIAFFGLAYPVLLAFALLFVLYWILRKSLWFLLSLLIVVIGWSQLNKNFGLRMATKPGTVKEFGAIRVMTYNVHSFKRFGFNNDPPIRNEFLDLIKQQNPDLIGFQEFYTSTHKQYHMVTAINKLLKTKGYYFTAFEVSSTDSIGMAIFSRYPIISHGLILITADTANQNQCLYIDVKKDNRVFRMYSVHLQSIDFDPQDYIYLKGVSHGKTNMHSTKRLAAKLKLAFVKRSQQVLKVKQSAAACPYPYIISGDFNDTPSSFAVNQMSEGLKNAFREKGSGFGKTYNGDFPNFQIDYIMVSPGFNVLNYDIIEKKLSDHYPVVSDLVLK